MDNLRNIFNSIYACIKNVKNNMFSEWVSNIYILARQVKNKHINKGTSNKKLQ